MSRGRTDMDDRWTRYDGDPQATRRPGGGRQGRGVPDSLLMGGLAFLLGLTALAWTATGLAALFARGAWPRGLSFTRTPLALRHLISDPHDLAGAWPDAPPHALSGYGLFWGILLGELMVLFVLVVFLIGTATRYRAVRARRRAQSRAGAPSDPAGDASWGPPPANGAGLQEGGPSVDKQPTPSSPLAPSPPVPGDAPAAEVPAVPIGGGGHPAGPAPTPPSPPSPPTHDQAVSTATTASPPDSPEALPTTVPASSAAGSAAWPQEPAPFSATPQLAAPGSPTAVPAGAAGAVPADGVPPLPALVHGLPRTAALDLAQRAVSAAAGPVVVATTAPALWHATKDARAKLGPLLTYDPLHLLDTPARLRWSPTAGCESLDVAAARAAALLAPVRPAARLDAAVADAAETLLRCWLHAAALDDRPFRQLSRWARAEGAAAEPVRALRTHARAAAGQAGELEAVLTAYPERRDQAMELVRRCLSGLSSVHLRDASNPLRADVLALGSFITEGGTLYLVGEPVEDPRTTPSAMPLFTALLSHVVEHGRRMAERSSDGRLDPPLTLVLDDIAALAPSPALPELLNPGHRDGLTTLATLRSPEQAHARWPGTPLPL